MEKADHAIVDNRVEAADQMTWHFRCEAGKKVDLYPIINISSPPGEALVFLIGVGVGVKSSR